MEINQEQEDEAVLLWKQNCLLGHPGLLCWLRMWGGAPAIGEDARKASE